MGDHVNPKLPPAVRAGMEPSYGWLMKTRLAFFNTAVSLLCVQRRCRSCSGGRAKLPTVRGDAVVFECAVPQVGRSAGGAMLPAHGGGQVRMPNRCRHCGCAKCDPHNKSCPTEQSLAWCSGRNGWLRHWGVDDGKMGRGPANPSCRCVFDVRRTGRGAGGLLWRYNIFESLATRVPNSDALLAAAAFHRCCCRFPLGCRIPGKNVHR